MLGVQVTNVGTQTETYGRSAFRTREEDLEV